MAGDLRDQLQSTLGNAYSLERELGGGGMSRVFLAHETRLGRTVVVKVLPNELAAGLSAERFEREIRLVEVTRSAPTLDDPRAVEFVARPDLGVPFPCTVVILSTLEWDAVATGRLDLPHPFRVGRLEPL